MSGGGASGYRVSGYELPLFLTVSDLPRYIIVLGKTSLYICRNGVIKGADDAPNVIDDAFDTHH